MILIYSGFITTLLINIIKFKNSIISVLN